MTLDRLALYVGYFYLVASALVAFLAALGALPGKAGEYCAKAAVVLGKAVAAVGEVRKQIPAPTAPQPPQVGP